MRDIIGKKNLYFAISLLVIIPGVISLLLWGLRLSIDFTGGSRMTLTFPQAATSNVQVVKDAFSKEKVETGIIQQSENQVVVRSAPIDQKKHEAILSDMQKQNQKIQEGAFETVGPVVGSETTTNALLGVGLASLLIVLYIAWAFREV